MTLTGWLAIVVLVVAAPLNWYVTVKLWRLSRSSRVPVIRERAIISLALAIIVTVFGSVFLNNDLATPVITPDVTKLITRLTVLIWSVIPAGYFLWLYRRS